MRFTKLLALLATTVVAFLALVPLSSAANAAPPAGHSLTRPIVYPGTVSVSGTVTKVTGRVLIVRTPGFCGFVGPCRQPVLNQVTTSAETVVTKFGNRPGSLRDIRVGTPVVVRGVRVPVAVRCMPPRPGHLSHPYCLGNVFNAKSITIYPAVLR